jgi:translocation and assembly module TamA
VAYTIRIAPTGDTALDAALHDASALVSLEKKAPAGAFALVARARADAATFATVMGGFGHYDGTVMLTIDGHKLDDPALAADLDAVPAGRTVAVVATPVPGPEFHLRHVVLQGNVPPDARAAFALKPGEPARAADVLAARDRLLAALLAEGHALAKVSPPIALLDPPAHALDVRFDVTAGPRVALGPIGFTSTASGGGPGRLRDDFLRRRLLLHPGEPYSPAKLAAARSDLAGLGAVGGVRIVPATALDAAGRLPVQVDVTERKLHAVNLTAAFSTDQGGSLGASWVDRDLFGRAEQLTLSAAATNLGGSAAVQPGYNIGAGLVLPDWLRRDQSLSFQLTGLRESLEAYDRTAAIASVTLSRKLSAHWTANIGLTGEKAHFLQEKIGRDYTLAQIPLGLAYDSTTSLFDPTSGIRAAVSLTPTESLGSGRNTGFLIAQGSASTYIDVSGTGRSVLALRGLVGSVQGAGVFAIPPDQRFYGGGSATIRGYRFQSVGPAFADGKPTGGTAIDAGTVEFRQRFGASYGAVAFVDAGQVSGSSAPFSGQTRVGAGVGARYYTAIGPIRLDIAVPLIKQQKNDLLEVYIGLGQAF